MSASEPDLPTAAPATADPTAATADPTAAPATADPTTASGLPNPHGLPEIAVDRPEVAVGAAFGGGLLLAMLLKRLGR